MTAKSERIRGRYTLRGFTSTFSMDDFGNRYQHGQSPILNFNYDIDVVHVTTALHIKLMIWSNAICRSSAFEGTPLARDKWNVAWCLETRHALTSTALAFSAGVPALPRGVSSVQAENVRENKEKKNELDNSIPRFRGTKRQVADKIYSGPIPWVPW